MKFEIECQLLSAGAFPYDLTSQGGGKGIAYNAKVIAGGSYYKVKITDVLYGSLQGKVEVKGVGEFEVTSSKEVNTVRMLSFKED